jgi:DNA-binding beta-propeller fold protein YncE
VWYDPGANNYYFAHGTQGGGAGAIGVVNAATEEFVISIPMEGSGVHSVAVNAKNGHIFVPVNGKGIFVITPGK